MLGAQLDTAKIHELNNLIIFFNSNKISAPKGFWKARAAVQQNLTGETPSVFSKLFKPLKSLELLELPVGKPCPSIDIEQLENILYAKLLKLKQKELTTKLQKYIGKRRVRVQLKTSTDIAMAVEKFVATLKKEINAPCEEKDKKAKFLQLTEFEKNLSHILKEFPKFVIASNKIWLNCKNTSENNFDSINQILGLPANFSVSESVKPSMIIFRAVEKKEGIFEKMIEEPLNVIQYLDEKIEKITPSKAIASITHDSHEEDKTSKQLQSQNNKDVINAFIELNTLIRCYNQHAISEPEGIRQLLGKVQDGINGTSASIFEKIYRKVGKIELITWPPDYLIKVKSGTGFLANLVEIKTKLTSKLEQEFGTKKSKFENLLNGLKDYSEKSLPSSKAEKQVAISLHVLFTEKYEKIQTEPDLLSKFEAITFLLKDLEAHYNGLVVLCSQNNFSPDPKTELFTELQAKVDAELSAGQKEEVVQRLGAMKQQRSQTRSKRKSSNAVNEKDTPTEELSDSAESLETRSSSSSEDVAEKTKTSDSANNNNSSNTAYSKTKRPLKKQFPLETDRESSLNTLRQIQVKTHEFMNMPNSDSAASANLHKIKKFNKKIKPTTWQHRLVPTPILKILGADKHLSLEDKSDAAIEKLQRKASSIVADISRCKTSFFNTHSLESMLTPLHKKVLALNESPEKKYILNDIKKLKEHLERYTESINDKEFKQRFIVHANCRCADTVSYLSETRWSTINEFAPLLIAGKQLLQAYPKLSAAERNQRQANTIAYSLEDYLQKLNFDLVATHAPSDDCEFINNSRRAK